jgi:hypothetical protein
MSDCANWELACMVVVGNPKRDRGQIRELQEFVKAASSLPKPNP